MYYEKSYYLKITQTNEEEQRSEKYNDIMGKIYEIAKNKAIEKRNAQQQEEIQRQTKENKNFLERTWNLFKTGVVKVVRNILNNISEEELLAALDNNVIADAFESIYGEEHNQFNAQDFLVWIVNGHFLNKAFPVVILNQMLKNDGNAFGNISYIDIVNNFINNNNTGNPQYVTLSDVADDCHLNDRLADEVKEMSPKQISDLHVGLKQKINNCNKNIIENNKEIKKLEEEKTDLEKDILALSERAKVPGEKVEEKKEENNHDNFSGGAYGDEGITITREYTTKKIVTNQKEIDEAKKCKEELDEKRTKLKEKEDKLEKLKDINEKIQKDQEHYQQLVDNITSKIEEQKAEERKRQEEERKRKEEERLKREEEERKRKEAEEEAKNVIETVADNIINEIKKREQEEEEQKRKEEEERKRKEEEVKRRQQEEEEEAERKRKEAEEEAKRKQQEEEETNPPKLAPSVIVKLLSEHSSENNDQNNSEGNQEDSQEQKEEKEGQEQKEAKEEKEEPRPQIDQKPQLHFSTFPLITKEFIALSASQKREEGKGFTFKLSFAPSSLHNPALSPQVFAITEKKSLIESFCSVEKPIQREEPVEFIPSFLSTMTPVDGYNLETFKQQCIESFTSNDVQQSVYFYDATQKTLLLTVVKDLENEEYYKTCFEENKEIQVETFKQLCEGFAKQHDVPAEKEQDSQPKEMTSADKEETTKITSSAEESYDDLGKTIVEFNDKEGITGEMQKWIKYFKSIITNTLENPPEATNSGLNDILQQYSAAVVNQAIIAIRIINNIILNFNELQTKEQIQKRVELFNNVVYDFYERQSQEKNEITKILEAKRGTEEVRQSLTTLEQNLAESICAIKKEAEKEAPGQESGHQK